MTSVYNLHIIYEAGCLAQLVYAQHAATQRSCGSPGQRLPFPSSPSKTLRLDYPLYDMQMHNSPAMATRRPLHCLCTGAVYGKGKLWTTDMKICRVRFYWKRSATQLARVLRGGALTSFLSMAFRKATRGWGSKGACPGLIDLLPSTGGTAIVAAAGF